MHAVLSKGITDDRPEEIGPGVLGGPGTGRSADGVSAQLRAGVLGRQSRERRGRLAPLLLSADSRGNLDESDAALGDHPMVCAARGRAGMAMGGGWNSDQ